MSKLGAFPDQALERLVLRHEFQPVQLAWLVPKASSVITRAISSRVVAVTM
jgi:hypothetical protein